MATAPAIAVSMCKVFRWQAIWTWRQLSEARALGHKLSEEALTDFNLLKLKAQLGRRLITHTFTKHAEAQSGSDWEWWFGGRSWLGFRVQAKVIAVRDDRFPHLHYKSRSGAYQPKLLCDRACSAQPRRIPLYCFYLQSESFVQRESVSGLRGVPETYGCCVADALIVPRLRPKDDLTALRAHLVPWHRLVCPSDESNQHRDLPLEVLECWKTRVRARDAAEFEFACTPEPPDYVLRLIENDLEEPPDPFVRSISVFRDTGA